MRTPTPKGGKNPRPATPGANGADRSSMTTRQTAPRVTRPQAAALLATPAAAVTLELATGTVALDPAPTDAVWEGTTHLVLATHTDAVAAAAEAAGHADFLGRLTRILNLELHRLAAAGELPTVEELEAVVAELVQYEQELAQVIPLRAGGAA